MSVTAPFRTELIITGMTCEHCVMSVTEEVSEIDGVSSVEVVLATGTLVVLSDRAVGRDEIAAAVAEAGFALA